MSGNPRQKAKRTSDRIQEIILALPPSILRTDEVMERVEAAAPHLLGHHYSSPKAGLISLLCSMAREGMIWREERREGRDRVVWGINVAQPAAGGTPQVAPAQADAAVTTEERIARVEARLASLERMVAATAQGMVETAAKLNDLIDLLTAPKTAVNG